MRSASGRKFILAEALIINKTYILFDLDGTISDPKDGITKSVQYSLKAFGMSIENTDALTPFIGPPLRESYKRYYGFSNEEAEKAVAKYREYFSEKGIFENTIYEGMDILLKTLRDTGKVLMVATSKPTIYAEKILKHFDIDQYFDFVSGSELDGRRSKKSELIKYALDNMNITQIGKAIMIGDREHDIIGAKEVCMDSIGVLYGYGDLRELTSAGATFISESVSNLLELLAYPQ